MTKDINKKTDYQCVNETKESMVPCNNTECRHNLNSKKYNSCALIAAEEGPLTLQEIGDFYGISRMRVCQIEKSILKKLKSQKNNLSDFGSLS